jgi:regulator of cell morphogenesis and NO signaling
MNTITRESLVGEIATAQPASIRVFQKYGIDFCCGGKRPLADVCEERQIAYDELANAIANAELPRDDQDWAEAPLGVLADHIVHRYHDTLRQELPRLTAMAEKVHNVHGAKMPETFPRLNHVFAELAEELISHMSKEEMILFPAVEELEAAHHEGRRPQTRFPSGALRMPISVMEQEHEHAGNLLVALRELTSGYQPPEWACNTFRGLYAGLQELERDLHVHIHLENNILFPRAAELDRAGF